MVSYILNVKLFQYDNDYIYWYSDDYLDKYVYDNLSIITIIIDKVIVYIYTRYVYILMDGGVSLLKCLNKQRTMCL